MIDKKEKKQLKKDQLHHMSMIKDMKAGVRLTKKLLKK